MKRIATIAFAAAISTLTLSAAQAGAINGISPNGLNTNNGISPNGIPTYNGLGSSNGLNTNNGIILNGLPTENGTLHGVSASETAGQAILEIHLPDGTVGRR